MQPGTYHVTHADVQGTLALDSLHHGSLVRADHGQEQCDLTRCRTISEHLHNISGLHNMLLLVNWFWWLLHRRYGSAARCAEVCSPSRRVALG